jgi:hypothetical protein
MESALSLKATSTSGSWGLASDALKLTTRPVTDLAGARPAPHAPQLKAT